ncbi:unnamed protein product [Closterium sp. NIES-64]|nr:unnamed protein product [Closterium sp. NIES-65]CAI5974534.1 unnamed protein product [Closterium sp. NIES-65]CAI6001273.1 unnamed protein product [Closterium sp. NIES-64]
MPESDGLKPEDFPLCFTSFPSLVPLVSPSSSPCYNFLSLAFPLPLFPISPLPYLPSSLSPLFPISPLPYPPSSLCSFSSFPLTLFLSPPSLSSPLPIPFPPLFLSPFLPSSYPLSHRLISPFPFPPASLFSSPSSLSPLSPLF